MGYMLEIRNISKTFNKGTINEKKALDGVNLNLNPGDFVTIIGGNGAGKRGGDRDGDGCGGRNAGLRPGGLSERDQCGGLCDAWRI